MSHSETARLNGSKSRGPVTADGKARSAMNALGHGLTAKIRISTESHEDLQALFRAYVEQWQPRNQVEHDLVEEMVAAKWQQRRIAEMETAIFNIEIEKQLAKRTQGAERDESIIQALAFQQLADNSKSVALLLRYQASHNRQYHRAINQLLKIRDHAAFPETTVELQNEPTAEPQAPLQNEPTPLDAAGQDPAGADEPSPFPAQPQFEVVVQKPALLPGACENGI